MAFIGFGYLATFLKKYGYGALVFNMLVSVVSIQWGMLVKGDWSGFNARNLLFSTSLPRLSGRAGRAESFGWQFCSNNGVVGKVAEGT